ncbi:hypothetical protein [Spirosoma oryzicola]|uniref:hypothetical protein n=1 Tax=Spirosoma oryzicola TaxID=2898794 RepID=UPI001E33C625|nr:hypothetical protein [Spirosoma oryzicola]UHG92673.1 hypothetical protein LQ777_07150 [Spirosoma oryzicola]
MTKTLAGILFELLQITIWNLWQNVGNVFFRVVTLIVSKEYLTTIDNPERPF